MKIIKIRDASGDGRYDQLLLYPDTMTVPEAVALVDNAVIQVQDARPDEFEWDDLMAVLEPLGFTTAEWCYASQTW